MGTTQRLAVDGHDLSVDLLHDRPNPGAETVLEMLGRQPGEDPTEGIVGRNAVGQGQEGFQPIVFGLPKLGNRHPTVGSTDRAADGDDQDIDEPMGFVAVDTGIGELGKMIDQRIGGTRHGTRLPAERK